MESLLLLRISFSLSKIFILIKNFNFLNASEISGLRSFNLSNPFFILLFFSSSFFFWFIIFIFLKKSCNFLALSSCCAFLFIFLHLMKYTGTNNFNLLFIRSIIFLRLSSILSVVLTIFFQRFKASLNLLSLVLL